MSDDVVRRRARNTRWAARRRERKLASANATAARCQHSHGGGTCGAQLEDRRDTMSGRIYRWCPWCDRRLRGVCRDCPRPVEGRIGSAVRCAEHKRIALRASMRASERRHHDERRATERKRYQTMDPAKRELRLAYKRAWRKLNPGKVRAQKRRFSLSQNRKHLAWHMRYNARRRAAKAETMKAQYYVEHPTRPAPVCGCGRSIPWIPLPRGNGGRPPKRCVFCLDPSQLRAAVKRWIARDIEHDARPMVLVKKVRPWKPKEPTRFNARGERLCLTPDCNVVLHGRRKKCDPCLAREAERARHLLAGRTGRGRRTDLQAVA